MKPYNIRISILYPPDVDTPGLAIENETKPEECKLLEGNIKLSSAEQVAKDFIKGIRKRKFNIFSGASKLYWLLYRFVPRLVRFYGDADYKKARKRLGKY